MFFKPGAKYTCVPMAAAATANFPLIATVENAGVGVCEALETSAFGIGVGTIKLESTVYIETIAYQTQYIK